MSIIGIIFLFLICFLSSKHEKLPPILVDRTLRKIIIIYTFFTSISIVLIFSSEQIFDIHFNISIIIKLITFIITLLLIIRAYYNFTSETTKKASFIKDDHQLQQDEANYELDSFAYMASHDLKTPLRSISSLSAILHEDYSEQLNNEAKYYIERIQKSTDRMNRLIDDLLTIIKIRRVQDQTEKIDLNGLVGHIIQDYKKIENIDIEFSIESILPVITCVPQKIKLVFSCLIDNAIKFSKNATQPKIVIGYKLKHYEHLFYVKDNGIGIETEYKDFIFEMFTRLNSPNEYDGSGVGLYLAKKVVEQNNGRIWLDSNLGEQTTFYFTVEYIKEK